MMVSKAEAKRRRKAWREERAKLPDLAAVEKREQHRVGGKFAAREPDPQKTAREARERQFGGGDTRKAQEAAVSPLLGHPMGYVIQSECQRDEAARLWDVWQAYSAAEHNYRKRILDNAGAVKGASIQMVPEPMETDPSLRIDLRDEEAKDRQAVASYMRWQGFLGELPTGGMSALRQAQGGTGKPLWQAGEGKPTAHGVFALAMLRALKVVLEK